MREETVTFEVDHVNSKIRSLVRQVGSARIYEYVADLTLRSDSHAGSITITGLPLADFGNRLPSMVEFVP